ncbi:cation:proton antiporter [Fervidicella metallireducens AeB]|uniref:Cation:proton antiporter n=1 Tax=Fervidicella metallireducens AeB TaxID=1403537 RepID=A0A017RVC7_9CLOT|nr:monovalent cation/H+ antiporter complex subunit F [Fervidicella metallireducens]EYE88374.1 cation:proton antiporter [Fervidicella metallireducens AeB]
MNTLIITGIFLMALALVLLYRVAEGPTVADRVVAADSVDILASVALVLFAVFSKRAIYLDIALTLAILGFIGTILISRYLEGKL